MMNNMDEPDATGKTPLMWAAFYGQTPTVSLLLRYGVDVNVKADEGETALHLAASAGHTDVVKTLIPVVADIDAMDENGCTPLMFAAMKNRAHVVHELLQVKADGVALTNCNGDSAIALAIKSGSTQAQQVLESHLLSLLRS